MSQSDCQFAVEDKSTDHAARVNVSRNGQKGRNERTVFFNIDIEVKKSTVA